jgi:hypothetical protein
MELVRLIKMYLHERRSKAHIVLSHTLPFHYDPKQGDLSPLILNFALECAIRKVQENQFGLKLNGTHHLLVYADNVNLLGDNIDTIKNAETLINAIKEVGLEVKADDTKYMLHSHHQNTGEK